MILAMRPKNACRAAQRLCSRRADGVSLTEQEENERAAHLALCPACRQKDAALAAQSALLRSMATSSQPSPLAEGAIAARAVSAWQAEQARSQTFGLPARFDKRFAFGLAALVVIAGAGTMARLAANKPHETKKIAQSSSALPQVQGRLLTENGAKTTRRPVRIPGSVPHPRKSQIAPAPIPFTAPHALAVVHNSRLPQRALWPIETVRIPSPNRAVAVPKVNTPLTGDDMAYLNGTPSQSTDFAGRWLHLTPNAAQNLQADIEKTIRTGDDFVDVPFPRLASTNGYDATTANAIARYRQEREIVDARLQRKITLNKKRVSFGDLCAHLETQTGIAFAANKSVADDKITVFCTDRPVRDVMREITTLFNFTWQRVALGTSDGRGEEGAYQYRLTQPLRAQLVEEELRNHDRNEALIALDKEMEKYKALAKLSPDEAKERAASATTEDEKKMYKNLAGVGWGAVQMYAGLSQDQLAALRDGQTLDFSAGGEGSGALPANTASGILQSLGDTMRMNASGGLQVSDKLTPAPGSVPPASIPGAMASARLSITADELGQFSLDGGSGFLVRQKDGATSGMSTMDLATGRSPSSQNPKNQSANADLKNKPEWQKTAAFPARDKDAKKAPNKITTADILEAIHKATGQDVIGDYYTRLYESDIVGRTSPRPLFDLLCDVSDKARLRWGSEENWLTFRSASFFNDRPKEVPNRFLERWASARTANQNALPPENILEIAQLSDGQLSASSMAEGAKLLYGLEEWDVARNATLRESWRLLASLSKNQQKAVLRGTLLRFDQLALPQQERFATQVLSKSDLASAALGQVTGADKPSPAEKLAGATLQVEYQAPQPPQTPPAKDAAPTPPTAKFIYRYGTESDPVTKTLSPGSTSVSRGTPKSK